VDKLNRKRNMNILTTLLNLLKTKKEPIPVSSPPKPIKEAPRPPVAQKKVGFSESFKPSPNVSPKPIKPQYVVLHHTAGSYAGSVAWCLNPASRVSYHCIIAEDGKRTVLARPNQRTWHAGIASWKGKKDLNSISVGVAFEKDTYSQPLTVAQMYSCLEYLRPIIKQYQIPFDSIIDHRMIAPNRKDDLNPTEYHKLKKFLLLHL